MKCEKHVVTLPVVKTGHKWDFAHVKNLCGQGRLYVKLNVSKDELLNRGNSDDELSKPTFVHTERALVEENAACVKVTRTQYHSRPGSVEDTCMEDMQSLVEHHQVS